jgi:Fungalysin metallopeptidase (M36)
MNPTRRRCSFLFSLFLPALALAAEQQIDVRRNEARAGDDIAGARRTAQLLERAASRLGGGIETSLDDAGSLRAFARHSPPLSRPDGRDTQTVAREFVAAHRDLLDLDPTWINNLELVAEDRSGPNQLLKFRQQWDGIPVFQSSLRIHVSPAGEIVELQFHLEKSRIQSERATLSTSIPSEQAVRAAASGLEPELRELRINIVAPAQGSRHRTELRFGPRADEVIAQWVWFPVGAELRLAWLFDAVSVDGETYYECVVDANNGALLYRHSITDSESIGLVFDGASPQPSATPGVLPPVPNPPAIVARKSVSFAGDPTASPQGWVGAMGETIGNNVTAREDRRGDNEVTLGATARASTDGSNLLFNFDLELGPEAPSPLNFTSASVTSLFYWCNVMHDYFYSLGFTEAAGNFQEDNFGRGGLGLDSLRADAQDNSEGNPPSRNNANFSTPLDGSRPRMQMYLWGNPGGPFVDSDFDAEVIIHEYTHGIFRRLAPAAGGSQWNAMNEGNSDFFALNYLTPPQASADGDFTSGSYSNRNFTRGIRTRPFSTKVSVNDLSYADYGRVIAGPEVHADGEIWVQAMWELRSRLVKRFGYNEGRRRVAQLMIDAMKRAPANASYVDMRDALVAADRANYAGEDVNAIWEAFARRGLGYMAATNNGSSLRVLPSQDLPSPLGKVRFFENVYYDGEPLRISVGDENNPDASVSLRVETSSGDRETLALPRAGSTYRMTLTPTSGALAPGDGRLQLGPGEIVRAIYLDSNDGTGTPREVVSQVAVRPAYSMQLEGSSFPLATETPLNLRGDNAARTIELPFGFPFYSRLVTSIWITTNGLITIGHANPGGGNSQTTLNSYAAIAPLWDDLRTDGSAQPGEDIYMSRPSPDSIRFRWIAESLRPGSPNGDPVNFAVTLFENGNIVFHYGSGNRGVSPTVGLSRGTETFMQIVPSHSSTGGISLENAQTVMWSFPGADFTTTLFPFFRGNAAQFTGYAAANYASTETDILFTARNDAGQPVSPRAAVLTAGAQLAQTGEQITGVPSAPDREGWIEARATSSSVAMFYLYGDINQNYLDGALASSRPGRDLVFSRIQVGSTTASGKAAQTSLFLVNPSNGPANIEIKWYDSAGAPASSVARTIPARGRLNAPLAGLFSFLPSFPDTGYIRATSDTNIAGVEVVEMADTVYMVPGQEPSAATTLYAAHFASGGLGGIQYFTDVNLINTSSSTRSISVSLLGNDGAPVTGPGLVNPYRTSLAPGAQLRIRGDRLFAMPDPAGSSTFYEGSLVVTASGAGIVGDITFGDAINQRFAASLPLDGTLLSDTLLAQVAEGSTGAGKPYFTGIALHNPNPGNVEILVQAYSQRGILTASSSFTMGGGTRLARTLAQLMNGFGQIGGYVRISSKGGPITTFGVYGDSSLDSLVAVLPHPVSP